MIFRCKFYTIYRVHNNLTLYNVCGVIGHRLNVRIPPPPCLYRGEPCTPMTTFLVRYGSRLTYSSSPSKFPFTATLLKNSPMPGHLDYNTITIHVYASDTLYSDFLISFSGPDLEKLLVSIFFIFSFLSFPPDPISKFSERAIEHD